MANIDLTQEELEIIDYVESGKAVSVSNLNDEIINFQKIAKNQLEKKKPINIRILESDLFQLKRKAAQKGLSYQNIIQSLIHQYVHTGVAKL